ncbi:MAG: hypothetical protein WC718_07485 [Phycisphaerales bacterium]
MTRLAPIIVALVVAAILSTLPGCVVWDIRDDLRKSNEQLTDVKQALDKANSALDRANADLDTANERLDKVEAGLTRLDKTNAAIDTTNQSLESLDKQLALLGSINTSLGHLDQHLAAVRKTIGSIDSMIPFMDLGGGPDETGVAAAAPAPAPPGEGGPAADRPSGEQVAIEAATQGRRRDAIEGVWVQRAPPDPNSAARLIVFLPDGRYWTWPGSISSAVTEQGTWSREGETIRLMPQQPIEKSTTTNRDGTKSEHEGPPPAYDYKVVYASGRALALESKGFVVVFGRP